MVLNQKLFNIFDFFFGAVWFIIEIVIVGELRGKLKTTLN